MGSACTCFFPGRFEMEIEGSYRFERQPDGMVKITWTGSREIGTCFRGAELEMVHYFERALEARGLLITAGEVALNFLAEVFPVELGTEDALIALTVKGLLGRALLKATGKPRLDGPISNGGDPSSALD